MNRIRITLSIALCAFGGVFLVASFAQLPRGTGQGSAARNVPPRLMTPDAGSDAEDADMPSWMIGRVDKADYLRRRGEHIDMLRGRPHGLDYDPRERAIQQMSEHERALQARLAEHGIDVDAAVPAWVPIGPAPIPNGQTSNVSVPVSGRTVAIAVHPTDANTVYVGTAQGGLYKSTNGGDTWTALFDDVLETLAIGAVTIDPVDSNIVYVGTGEAGFSADSFAGRGMYIIRDANSASPTISGPFRQNGAGADIMTGRATGEIVVPPTNNNILFISTTSGNGGNPNVGSWFNPPVRGIYRSTNAQSDTPTFEKVTITGSGDEDRDVVDMAMDPGDPNVLLATVAGASGDGGIYRTTNALDTTPVWVRTRVLPDGAREGGRAELSFVRNGSTPTVYAAVAERASTALGYTANCTTGGYVIKSTDGGATWGNPLPGSGGYCGTACFYDIAIAARPDDTTVHLGGWARFGTVTGCRSDIMKRSTAGGSFVRNDATLHPDTHAIAIAPSDPNVVYTGNDGGIWRSGDNGTTWVSKNNMTFSATQFQDLALHPFDRHFMIGGTQDNGTNCLSPDGTTWLNCQLGDGGYTTIDRNAFDTTNVTMYHTFANSSGSFIAFERADNTDYSWVLRGCLDGDSTNGLDCNDAVLFYPPMAQGPGNPNTIYFGTDRLYRSTDRGDTMAVVSQGPLQAGVPLTTIGISPQDDNVRIVGNRQGRVWATTTGSATMPEVTGANFPPPNPSSPTRKAIGRAMIDPSNKFTAYITFTSYGLPLGQHVFKTTNLNSATPNWTPSSNGIPDVPVNAMAIDPADSNSIYVGTDIGVYHSSDGGANWTPFGTRLPRVAVFDMEINAVHRILRIATHGRGIYEANIGGIGVAVIRTDNAAITGESCSPANGAIDPNETVTVAYTVKNIGGGPSNPALTVTLRATGGVVNPSAPQNYGAIVANGTATRNFTFTASGACNGTINLTFEVNDGTNTFALPAIDFVLGELVTSTPAFAENFDGVTPPALPPGWTTTSSGAASPWTTTTTFSDSAPNSAAVPGTPVGGETTLTSPIIAIPAAPGNGTNPGVQLTFRNNYNTEFGYDGGVLEISINGGPFSDIIAAGGSFVTGGYKETIGDTDSPLTGRPAWTGNSNGFITSTVNLPASAFGQNAQFRWRTAYDSFVNPPGAGQRIDSISIYAATRVCCLDAPAPMSAVSRKDHNGASFDIDLLTGSRVECRRPGARSSHQMVVSFPQPVTVGSVMVSSKDNAATGFANTSGNEVIVNLANVADGQTLVVTLINVSDGSATGNVPIQMPILLGDSNGDRVVNSGDAQQTRNRSGQETSATNFRSDYNVDGTINSGDATIVRNRSGQFIP